MAANVFANGSGDGTVVFDRAVNHLNVFVAAAAVFAISLDSGENFLSLPVGFHSFPVGSLLEVHIQSTGLWQLVGIQA